MPTTTTSTRNALTERFARVGAMQAYAELQQQLSDIATAFPDIVEEFHEHQKDMDGDGGTPRTRLVPVRRAKRQKKTRAGKKPLSTAAAAAARRDSLSHTEQLSKVLIAHMPFREKLAPQAIVKLVKENGYEFPSTIKHHDKLVASALASLVEMKVVAKTGHARGTRYELVKN